MIRCIEHKFDRFMLYALCQSWAHANFFASPQFVLEPNAVTPNLRPSWWHKGAKCQRLGIAPLWHRAEIRKFAQAQAPRKEFCPIGAFRENLRGRPVLLCVYVFFSHFHILYNHIQNGLKQLVLSSSVAMRNYSSVR